MYEHPGDKNRVEITLEQRPRMSINDIFLTFNSNLQAGHAFIILENHPDKSEKYHLRSECLQLQHNAILLTFILN